jgi:hypothetical protein
MQELRVEAIDESAALSDLQVPSAAFQEAFEGGFDLGPVKAGVGNDIPQGRSALGPSEGVQNGPGGT